VPLREQLPHGPTRARIQASAVDGRLLTPEPYIDIRCSAALEREQYNAVSYLGLRKWSSSLHVSRLINEITLRGLET
jgi:hypothetical protein